MGSAAVSGGAAASASIGRGRCRSRSRAGGAVDQPDDAVLPSAARWERRRLLAAGKGTGAADGEDHVLDRLAAADVGRPRSSASRCVEEASAAQSVRLQPTSEGLPTRPVGTVGSDGTVTFAVPQPAPGSTPDRAAATTAEQRAEQPHRVHRPAPRHAALPLRRRLAPRPPRRADREPLPRHRRRQRDAQGPGRADTATGEWSLNRQFTRTGRFGSLVRTGQDFANAPAPATYAPR